jgi:hypothetical protein
MKETRIAIIVLSLLAFSACFAVEACFAVPDYNLLTNEDFETNLSSWTKAYRVAGKADATWQSGGVFGSLGSADLWFSSDYSSGVRTLNLWQEFAVNPGETYNVGAYLKANTGSSVGDGYTAWLDFSWYDANYVKKGSSVSSTLLSPNNDWELFSTSGVVSSDAAYGRLILRFHAPATPNTYLREVLFDNAFAAAAPEPVSAALFLLGGAAIAIGRRKDRRTK